MKKHKGLSKSGALNTMFDVNHSEKKNYKYFLTIKKNKYSNYVGIYDLHNNIIRRLSYA